MKAWHGQKLDIKIKEILDLKNNNLYPEIVDLSVIKWEKNKYHTVGQSQNLKKKSLKQR